MTARLRLSIRTRLALLYGAVFFGMGLALMAISYAIVDHSLSPPATTGTVRGYIAWAAPGTIPQLPPSPPDTHITIVLPNRSAGGPGGTDPSIGLQGLLTDVRDQTLHGLVWAWAALVALLAAAAGAFGWLLSARLLKPLRDITGTARRLSAANLHERIDLDGRGTS